MHYGIAWSSGYIYIFRYVTSHTGCEGPKLTHTVNQPVRQQLKTIDPLHVPSFLFMLMNRMRCKDRAVCLLYMTLMICEHHNLLTNFSIAPDTYLLNAHGLQLTL